MIAVGVDTHKEKHLAVAVDDLGQLLAEITITANLAGYRGMADWLGELKGEVLVGIEGAGSFGAGLCEYLQAEGVEVFEVERPRRRERRTGKSDRLDALIASKKVLAREGLSTPRGSGTRLALQMLLVAYRSVVGERSRLYNQLQALHVGAPVALRERIGPARNGTKTRGASHRHAHTPHREPAREHHPASPPRHRQPHQDTRRPGRELHPRNRGARPLPRPKTHGGARCRADLRRQAPGVQPRALHQRGSIRTRQRHRTTTSLIRQNHPPPPQPRRRPTNQRRDLHDRALTLRSPRPEPRLHHPQNRRRKDQARGHAIPQATPLPPPLQAARKNTLDNIEASNEFADELSLGALGRRLSSEPRPIAALVCRPDKSPRRAAVATISCPTIDDQTCLGGPHSSLGVRDHRREAARHTQARQDALGPADQVALALPGPSVIATAVRSGCLVPRLRLWPRTTTAP